MTRAEHIILPTGGTVAGFHAAKHAIFQRMYDDQMAYRKIMDNA